jgi:hypothetical protein
MLNLNKNKLTMNLIKSILSIALIVGFTIAFVSCNEDDDLLPVVATTINDLNADYAPYESPLPTNRPPLRIGATNKFTLFSFKTGAIVPNADSTSSNWDIGFRSTTIIVNSGTSGPGTTTAQILNGTLTNIIEAPFDGYKSDNNAGTTPAERNAIPSGSGNGWYTYTGATNLVAPIAGKVIVVKTAENRYAKLEILSYYQGAPASPSPEPTGTDKDRYYTFRYVYQPNDTRIF